MPPRKKTAVAELATNPFAGFLHKLAPRDAVEPVDTARVWDFIPPSLPEFITSEVFLGQAPLSARQQQALLAGFGRDGRDLFEQPPDAAMIHELILVYGKGAGKDMLASYVIAYVTYVVLCLHNPQQYFQLAQRSSLDIVNVATRQEQANDVFFSVLEGHIRRPCFHRWKPLVKKATIRFAIKGVRIHSLHSKAQRWEGFNILAWVMDEADAFATANGNANAEEIHNVLQSSAISRFPGKRWLGMIISYPRAELGFILDYAAKADKAREAGRPFAYVDRGATWEIHPHYDPTHPFFQDFPWVEVHDGAYRVPQPYQAAFEADPTSAAMTYMCLPPPMVGAFFEYPDLLEQCVDDEPPLVWVGAGSVLREVVVATGQTLAFLRETKGPDYTGIEVQPYCTLNLGHVMRTPPANAIYYLHGDPGETKDSFAIAMARVLPETAVIGDLEQEVTLNKVAIDLLLEWKPQHNRPVDYLNVRDVIVRLCESYNILQVTFDRFQSAQVVQELMEAGVNCRQMSFANSQQLAMYKALKGMVYNHLITWPRLSWDTLRPQLRYLVLKNGNKITHDESKSSKDLADAVAAAAWFASGAALGRLGRDVMESTYGTGAPTSVGYVNRRLTR